jgi:hypothetical protein
MADRCDASVHADANKMDMTAFYAFGSEAEFLTSDNGNDARLDLHQAES